MRKAKINKEIEKIQNEPKYFENRANKIKKYLEKAKKAKEEAEKKVLIHLRLLSLAIELIMKKC